MICRTLRFLFCLLAAVTGLLSLLSINLAAQRETPSNWRGLGGDSASSIWEIVKTPMLNPDNVLHAIAADAENNIWAVGYEVSLHFNGNSWASVPMAPFKTGVERNMNGLAVLSPTDVWAVGSDLDSNQHFAAVVQHFDGKGWSIVPSPHFLSGDLLNGIQAISANNIFAVGSRGSDFSLNTTPLIEHWDGSKWKVVRTPQMAAELNQIAVLSPSDIWVVGETTTTNNLNTPFSMHFDGKKWSQVPVPAANVSFNALRGVAAISTNDVWAVGSSKGAGLTDVSLTAAEHWNGHVWRVVPTPNAGRQGQLQGTNLLFGVSAVDGSDVWACGVFVDSGSGAFRSLAEHWNGTKWTISATPQTGTGFDQLRAILTFPSRHVFAAGGKKLVTQDGEGALILQNKAGSKDSR
jgi:hypothetical protein